MYALPYWLAAAIVAKVGGAGAYTEAQVDASWHDLLSVIVK